MAKKTNQHGAASTLPEAGINHTQSSRWQAVASVPERAFEAHVAETKAAGRELTTTSVRKLAMESRPVVTVWSQPFPTAEVEGFSCPIHSQRHRRHDRGHRRPVPQR